MPADPLERQALRFSAAILIACLMLQRFGVPLSGKMLSIVGPVGLALAAAGLLRGTLSFHRGRLVAFLILSALVLAGAAWQAVSPGTVGERAVSGNSLVLFLALSGFATLTFTRPVREADFFRVVNFWFTVVAVAGIAQFFAQFAGLRVFAFTGLLPASVLIEATYHLEIPAGFGGLLKSNGLVLIEPSVFSQIMALGIIIEALGTRRPWQMAAFVTGLLLSFSGTGWIVLAALLPGAAIGLGWRGLAIAAGVVAILGTALGAASLLTPDAITALSARMGEIDQPGTSGHLRFITPFWMLGDVFSAAPSALLAGIGSGRGEQLTLPYDYTVNTATKVLVEYGAPALVAYVALFALGRKTRIQTALVLPALVLFLFTGGYQEFSPVIFITLLLIAVARLREDGAPDEMPT